MGRIVQFERSQPDQTLLQSESTLSVPTNHVNSPVDADEMNAQGKRNVTVGSSVVTTMEDEEVRTREWDIIKREKKLIEQERI